MRAPGASDDGAGCQALALVEGLVEVDQDGLGFKDLDRAVAQGRDLAEGMNGQDLGCVRRVVLQGVGNALFGKRHACGAGVARARVAQQLQRAGRSLGVHGIAQAIEGGCPAGMVVVAQGCGHKPTVDHRHVGLALVLDQAHVDVCFHAGQRRMVTQPAPGVGHAAVGLEVGEGAADGKQRAFTRDHLGPPGATQAGFAVHVAQLHATRAKPGAKPCRAGEGGVHLGCRRAQMPRHGEQVGFGCVHRVLRLARGRVCPVARVGVVVGVDAGEGGDEDVWGCGGAGASTASARRSRLASQNARYGASQSAATCSPSGRRRHTRRWACT